MSKERTVNDIMDNLTNMLVEIAKRNNPEEIEKTVSIMEEGWAKMDAFDFNKELAKVWRENHKSA